MPTLRFGHRRLDRRLVAVGLPNPSRAFSRIIPVVDVRSGSLYIEATLGRRT